MLFVNARVYGQFGSGELLSGLLPSIYLGGNKTTDKVVSKAAAGKREGMRTEQLLQMPAVRTDRLSITGFITFTAQGTVIKRNLRSTKSNPSDIYGFVGQYTQCTIQ